MMPGIKPALLIMAMAALPASASLHTEWETFLRGRDGCRLNGCCATDDGGMAAAGRLSTLDPDLPMIYLVKIGPQGDIQWETGVGWEASCSAWEVLQLGRGYIVCGELATREGDLEGFVMRFDYFGRELWRRRLGGAGDQRLRDMTPAVDGGCYLVGDSRSGSAGSELWLLRLDAGGETVWSRSISGGPSETGWGICMMPDSLLAACGGSGEDMTLTVVDRRGNRLLHRSYDNAGGREYGRSVAASASGDLCIAGSSRNPGRYLMDAFVLATDGGGDELWRRLPGGDANDVGSSVSFLGDSLLLVYNTMSEGAGSYDAVVEIASPTGEPLERAVVGDRGWNRIVDMEPGPDGRVFMVGGAGPPDSGPRSGWAVMMSASSDTADVRKDEELEDGDSR
jgi:hypothetical protein